MAIQLIPIDEITILRNRQRRVFETEAINELAEGIKSRGLMHPVVLRRGRDGEFVLVAGERRLKALELLWLLDTQVKFNGSFIPFRSVPYTDLGKLSPIEAEEAELEENTLRQDLSWQEKANAISRLHELRSKQAHAEGRIQTVGDTALEVKGRSDGSAYQDIRANLLVSKHLDDPSIQKATTVNEALKILKKKEEHEKFKELGITYKHLEKSSHTLINGDCLKELEKVFMKFDVIVSDPPYGMDAQDFSNGAGTLNNFDHSYEDSYEIWKALMEQVAPLAFQVAKAEAHLYMFCDIDNFGEMKEIFKRAGWYVFRTPLINYKLGTGRIPIQNLGIRRQWDMILFAIKGNKTANSIQSDVIPSQMDDSYSHGAVKPVNLFTNLLGRSAKPGDEVLDMFAGSGPMLPAAHALKLKSTLIELNPTYFGMILDRREKLLSVDSEDK